jgi:hypothetical protein
VQTIGLIHTIYASYRQQKNSDAALELQEASQRLQELVFEFNKTAHQDNMDNQNRLQEKALKHQEEQQEKAFKHQDKQQEDSLNQQKGQHKETMEQQSRQHKESHELQKNSAWWTKSSIIGVVGVIIILCGAV